MKLKESRAMMMRRGKLNEIWHHYNVFCNRVVGKVLCGLGRHRWVQTSPMNIFFTCDVKCTRCGKRDVDGLIP